MELQDIKTVYETSKINDCNKLLKNGWVLLAVNQFKNGDIEMPVAYTEYILGNPTLMDILDVDNFLHPPKKYADGWEYY